MITSVRRRRRPAGPPHRNVDGEVHAVQQQRSSTPAQTACSTSVRRRRSLSRRHPPLAAMISRAAAQDPSRVRRETLCTHTTSSAAAMRVGADLAKSVTLLCVGFGAARHHLQRRVERPPRLRDGLHVIPHSSNAVQPFVAASVKHRAGDDHPQLLMTSMRKRSTSARAARGRRHRSSRLPVRIVSCLSLATPRQRDTSGMPPSAERAIQRSERRRGNWG